MSYRNPDLTDKWIKSVPGPGSYEKIKVTNQELKGLQSKFVSAPSTRFGKLKRLTEAEIKNPKTPGPGECKSLITIDSNITDISKPFKRRSGSMFPKSNRPQMANRNKVPGPGEQ